MKSSAIRLNTIHPFTKIREQFNLSLKEFAAIVEVTSGTLNSMVGFHMVTGYPVTERVAKAFEIELSYLWSKTEEAKKEANIELKTMAEKKYKVALKRGFVIKL